jgi:biopolymer transport protein ExbB
VSRVLGRAFACRVRIALAIDPARRDPSMAPEPRFPMDPTAPAPAAVDAAARAAPGLDIPAIIDKIGDLIYISLALLAVWGVYNAILLYRTLGKKGLENEPAGRFIGQVRDLMLGAKASADSAIALCRQPPWWHTALAQLMAVALQHRDQGLAKVKQMLVMEFHTEVVSGLENRLATIGTIVRMGPLLGLLGTVASMIAAFGRIGSANAKVNPGDLAKDISLALWATAAGLLIATALMLVGNDIHARLRRLRDRTERQLVDCLAILEELDARAGRPRSGTHRAVLPK